MIEAQKYLFGINGLWINCIPFTVGEGKLQLLCSEPGAAGVYIYYWLPENIFTTGYLKIESELIRHLRLERY